MARRRFFVDEIVEGRALVVGANAHHLTRVLRVEAGQQFEISNNRGVFVAEIESARKDMVTFRILEAIEPEEALVQVTVYASLVRFERFEALLEKATELGAAKIVPVQAERSEKGLELAAIKRRARWERIIHEASEQSRRTRLTEIADPVRLREALGQAQGLRLALDEDRHAQPILNSVQAVPAASVSIIAGPEGGWTDRERALIGEAAWRPVSLGRTVLKTETAVIAALAIVNAAWLAAPNRNSAGSLA